MNPTPADDDIPCVDHWIGGGPHRPASEEYLDSTDPRTGAPVARIARGTPPDVDAAVVSAREAQSDWALRPPVERSRILLAIAAALRDDRERLAELEVAETGKLSAELPAEHGTAADYFEYYAGALRFLHGDTINLGADSHVFTRQEPYGVVGIITPWNGPLNQAARSIAPAIAVGNAVVVKPSEFTSTTTLELGRIATAAGLPPGVLDVVTGTGEDAGAPLVRHPAVGRVTFTGSVVTGRVVARIAAERLIPVTYELGGKSRT